jgi:transcription elongation factor GreB
MARDRLPRPRSSAYITPEGVARLRAEYDFLWKVKRPQVTQAVSEAAALGDRSENAEYIYGKKQLREIDRRIRFLTKRMGAAELIDPSAREATDQVFFGATVTLADQNGRETSYAIVGIDEADVTRGRISWISPLARALLKRHEGERIVFKAPGGDQVLEIVGVEYKPLD